MQAVMTPTRKQAWRYRGPMINYDQMRYEYGKWPEQYLASVQEGFEAGHLVPEDFNIQQTARAIMGPELYRAVVDGPEGFGTQGWLNARRAISQYAAQEGGSEFEAWKFGHNRQYRAQESGAVELGDFANITGQIYFSAIMDAYALEKCPFYDLIPHKMSPIPTVEKLPGITNLGDGFNYIGESDQYPLLGVTEDWIQVAEKRKIGGIVPLTKEAIRFDLTGVLMDRAQALGPFMKIHIEKQLIDATIDQNLSANTIYAGGARYQWKGTSYATYQASTPWINVTATNGLVDWTNIQNALVTGSKIVDPYTGEPFPIEPKHLIVSPNNLFAARRVVHATQVFVATPGYATSGNPNLTEIPNPVDEYQIVSSRLLGARMDLASESRSDWFLGDLAAAFARFYNWDVTPEQSSPNSHENFYRDILVAHKISTRHCFATIQPRVMLKNTP